MRLNPLFLALPPLFAAAAAAQEQAAASPFRTDQVAHLAWRNLGPPNMSGRLTDLAVHDHVWYVASAGGGLWKTVNRGTTWTPLFDREAVVSIGDVAVAPANPDIVWVGTGEENARNSVSWGDGVYKSTDAGKTWKHMGLKDSFQIGHIEIHPTDPNVVFVGALGRLWGSNRERGVFRTKDGGRTWENVLFVDAKTGCIDVRVHPRNPDVVWACMYERRRGGFDDNDPDVRFGDAAGLYKSTDGGDTWNRVNDGLPTCRWGRSGLAVYAANPDVLYMIVETERSGWATGDEMEDERSRRRRNRASLGIRGEDDEEAGGVRITAVSEGSPAAEAGLLEEDIVVAVDDKEIASYRTDLVAAIRAAKPNDKATYTVRRGSEELQLEVTYGSPEPAGGLAGLGAEGGPNSGRLGGQNPNVQGSQGSNGFQTGGVFRSDDAGSTWKRVNSLTERPFYYSMITVDPNDDDRVYCVGVSLWGSSNGGRRFGAIHRNQIHVDFHHVWVDPNDGRHLLALCDGGINETHDRARTWDMLPNLPVGQFYHVDVDSETPYNVYGGLQDNGTWGGPSRTRFRDGITWEDWFKIYSGDGFGAAVDPEDPDVIFCTSQNGNVGRYDRKTGRSAPVRKPRGMRWNWDTPFFVSPHNHKTLYLAGNHALRSVDHGRNTQQLTTAKLGLTDKGTATAFAESPRVLGLLYVGTDDGAFWRSDDGGRTWEELHGRIWELPGPRYVSSIQPSAHADDRVYVTFDGHRSDDFASHVFVSEDRGASWRSLVANLPAEPCHVLCEDPVNADLLFLGTELGCWASLDRGGRWLPLGDGLPTVAVRDAVIPRHDADLVIATHGRGIWVLDIAPLRQLDAKTAAEPAHLFAPETAVLWQLRGRGRGGDRHFVAANPAYGATVYLWLAEVPDKAPKVTIHDVTGEELASLTGARRAGIQALQWSAQQRQGRSRQPVDAGTYAARFQFGDRSLVQMITLVDDPLAAAGAASLTDPTTARN